MLKEIKFKIEVDSEKTFEDVRETIRVYFANLELAGALEIVDVGITSPSEKE